MVVAPFLPSKKLLRFLIIFGPVLSPSGLPLASLLAPFGSFWPPFWLPLASCGLPFGAFCHPLASSRLPGVCRASKAFLRQRKRNFGEILPRSCRDSAENVPRICQEPAKNPPYEPQAKLPFKLQVLRNDFVRRQTLSQNRPEHNVGRRCPPLGGLQFQ